MKIGILVTARLGSKRLTDKHLAMIGPQPGLGRLLDRLTPCLDVDVALFIATGDRVQNAPLKNVAAGKSVTVVYGDPDNIPQRHLQIARKYHLDAIVSVDGDDLLTSPAAVRAVIAALRHGHMLAGTEGLPFGMNAWGYTSEALASALQAIPDHALLETGWGRIFMHMPRHTITYAVPHADRIRASLDYPEDLEFFRTVYLYCPSAIITDDNALCAWILAQSAETINASRHTEYWRNFMAEQAKESAALDNAYSQRLHAVIPGGAHTYSRGDDQYPDNAPKILERGKGAYVWTPDGRRFLDYGMALRAVNIGYAEPAINEAAIREIEKGNNLTRASTIELEAAELLVSLIDSVDMIKFTKNGSTATSAAVKLARAFTGRELVARCAEHPFFSYDDWFIGSTPITRGIPQNIIEQTKSFNYNDIASLERLLEEHSKQFACVILEPMSLEEPKDDFLKKVQALCKKHGVVFILDEMITGFRWHLKGAQHLYGVTPDLSCFGKAMANGFSVAAVAGRREIMQLGAIDKPGMERLFLLSTTHGAEMCGLGAFIETVRFLEREKVIPYLWGFGRRFSGMMRECAAAARLDGHFTMIGADISPAFVFYDEKKEVSLPLRTLFLQELIKSNILMPWLSFCYRHGEEELALTRNAVAQAMETVRRALDEGLQKYLVGPVVKPVFRKFN